MPFNKSTSNAISLLHVGFWIALYFLPFIDPRGIHSLDHLGIKAFLNLHILVNYIFFIILFYTNTRFLVPKYLINREYIKYVIFVVFCISFILFCSYLIFPFKKAPLIENVPNHRLPNLEIVRFQQIISLLFPLFFILLVSTLYQLLISKYQSEKKQKEKENEQLKTELSFLRSQISPHFIFNALNSSIILVRKQSEKAEESLIKLASLMRYMLYESDNEKITVSDEVEYIDNYIDLQLIRFEKSVSISKDINVDEILNDEFIESMLLIPFIENAFKHGTLVLKEAKIEIILYNQDDKLILITKNKFNNRLKESITKQKNNGIGLSNVKRRLELLYPSNHILKIETIEDLFTVYLSIDLKK
jgi:sensor histidine kinase YesM